MQSFNFIIVAAGLNPDASAFYDRFFEAGCSDALVAHQRGRILIEFDREARTFLRAVISALADVKSTGAEIIRLEPDNLVSASEIAKRSSLGRAAISLYAKGERREDFPAPVARIATEQPLYDWAEVADWLYCHNQIALHEVVKARITRSCNMIISSKKTEEKTTRRLSGIVSEVLGRSIVREPYQLRLAASQSVNTNAFLANTVAEAFFTNQGASETAESLEIYNAA